MTTLDNLSAEQTFRNLTNIEKIQGSVTFGLGSIPKGEYHINYRNLNISQDLANEFSSLLNKKIEHLKKDVEEQNIRLFEYNAGYKAERDVVEWVKFENVTWLANLLSDIPEPVDIPLFDRREKEFLKDLRFYAIFGEDQNHNKIIGFSFYNKMKEITQSNQILTRFIGDRFELVTGAGFIFDERIDCIAYGDYIFSFSKFRFHKIFRYYDKMREVAQESMTTINSCIPISDFDGFQTACMSHFQKFSKLVNIAEKPYLSTLKMTDIRKSINKHNLPLEIIMEDGIEKLKFEKQNVWVILNVIDDAYLDSVMTNRNYEVNSKRLLQ